jgi:hypothetical protein
LYEFSLKSIQFVTRGLPRLLVLFVNTRCLVRFASGGSKFSIGLGVATQVDQRFAHHEVRVWASDGLVALFEVLESACCIARLETLHAKAVLLGGHGLVLLTGRFETRALGQRTAG